MTLRGQVALVVGGASGIGLATVKCLLREGVKGVVCDIAATGYAVVQELQAEFGAKHCLFVQADVRNDAELEAAFTTTKKNFEKLDILINCAGLVNESDWNLAVDINLKGTIRGTLLAWKHMGKHEGGSGGTVVNVASIAGLMALHAIPIYCATKHAMLGFSRSCGEEYHQNLTGVRVMTVCPGETETPLFNHVKLLSEDLEEEFRKLKAAYPVQKADNVAKGILHMLQHGASGSVWVSEDGKPAYQLEFPAYTDLRLTQ